jgi:Fe-S-cluster containining protein
MDKCGTIKKYIKMDSSIICSKKCCGVDLYDGGCCSIDDRDYIIGPIKDYDIFLEKLSLKIGRKMIKEEVFIDYEEGKNLFPNKPVWQKKENYPAFRFDLTHPRKYCIFYNNILKNCSVYDIRPETCVKFVCEYLKNNI